MNRRIGYVSCGTSHTVVVDSAGEVYTWGFGDRGQLGNGSFTSLKTPTALLSLASRAQIGAEGSNAYRQNLPRDIARRIVIRQVASGEDHNIALADNGHVLTWGAGTRGQLGQGSFKDSSTPIWIKGIRRRVAEVAAGAHHSLALVVAGSVFSWGSGPQLGTGVFTGSGDVASPQCVRSLLKFRVRHIDCGWDFSAAATHSGDVYTWGENGNGQLGVETSGAGLFQPWLIRSAARSSAMLAQARFPAAESTCS